jgi:hypothetical protein
MAKLKNNPDYTRIRLGLITNKIEEAIEKHIFVRIGDIAVVFRSMISVLDNECNRHTCSFALKGA